MQRTPEIAGGQKQQLKMFSAREKKKKHSDRTDKTISYETRRHFSYILHKLDDVIL